MHFVDCWVELCSKSTVLTVVVCNFSLQQNYLEVLLAHYGVLLSEFLIQKVYGSCRSNKSQGDANAGGQWTAPWEPWAWTTVALAQTVVQGGQQLEDIWLRNSILINAVNFNSIKNLMEPDRE